MRVPHRPILLAVTAVAAVAAVVAGPTSSAPQPQAAWCYIEPITVYYGPHSVSTPYIEYPCP